MMKAHTFLVFVILLIFATACGAAEATQPAAPPQPGETYQAPSRDPADTDIPGSPQTTEPVSQPLAPMEVVEPESGDLPELPPCKGAPTSPNMEGPYYTSGSPQRTTLIEPGMPGVPLLILGRVFDGECNPIAGAKVDFWQADMNGVYDNAGYTLRGHAITNEDGYYEIETIEPGLYTGRPPHIHVKVFAPDGRETLTTQLYFPGSEDTRDVAAAPDLLVSYSGEDEAGRQLVFFNFEISN
jgi:protocatechuate 3,4-dioxygenase beta subunit